MATKAQRRLVMDKLIEAGLEPHAAAGVMGNLMWESGGLKSDVVNSIGAAGIAQWYQGRRSNLEAFARKRGKPWTDLGTQADFLVSELKSGNWVTVRELNATKNVGQATVLFEKRYEISGDTDSYDERKQYAREALNLAKNRSEGRGGKSGGGGKTYTWVPGMTDVGYNPFKKPNPNYEAGYHTGNDISAADGAKIIWAPPVDGEVISSGWNDDYGHNMVVRDDKGREWLFAHLKNKPPKVGRKFQQGDEIAQVGNSGTSTGPHLHIEQTVQGKGTWSYDSELLKNPKLSFVARSDYRGGSEPGNDVKPGDYISGLGVARSWLDNPGMDDVRELVRKAAKNDWSQDRFMWKLRETEWYINRSEAQRKFDMMQSRDQQETLRQEQQKVRDAAAQFGVSLTDKQVEREAFRKARDGDDDEMMRDWIARKYVYDPAKGQSGMAATFQEQLIDFANDYGVTLQDKDLQQWTRKMISDGAQPGEFEDDMRERAQGLYSWLDLTGKSTRQALASYLQVAANELDIDPNTVDLTDPKWTEVQAPDADGLLSAEQFREKIVNDKRYGWDTSRKGKEGAANLAASLGRIFGGLNG